MQILCDTLLFVSHDKCQLYRRAARMEITDYRECLSMSDIYGKSVSAHENLPRRQVPVHERSGLSS